MQGSSGIASPCPPSADHGGVSGGRDGLVHLHRSSDAMPCEVVLREAGGLVSRGASLPGRVGASLSPAGLVPQRSSLDAVPCVALSSQAAMRCDGGLVPSSVPDSATLPCNAVTKVGLPPPLAMASTLRLPCNTRVADWKVAPASDTTADVLLRELAAASSLVPWRLRSANGQVIAMGEVIPAGLQVQVDAAVEPSADMVLARVSTCTACAVLQGQVSNEIRRSVASGLGPWMTDDVVADGLKDMQGQGGAVCVWADPVLLTAGFQSQNVNVLPRVSLLEGHTLLGACVLGGHWVAFCWQKVAGFVLAWTSLAGFQMADEVGHVHWMFANQAGEGLGVFKFRDAPLRDLPPGMCGPAALIDLRAYLLRQPHCQDDEVLRQATQSHSRRMLELHRPGTGRMPCLVAGVLGAMLEQGLTCLLKEKGVPEAAAGNRAKDLILRAGPQAVQKAPAEDGLFEFGALLSDCPPLGAPDPDRA